MCVVKRVILSLAAVDNNFFSFFFFSSINLFGLDILILLLLGCLSPIAATTNKYFPDFIPRFFLSLSFFLLPYVFHPQQ